MPGSTTTVQRAVRRTAGRSALYFSHLLRPAPHHKLCVEPHASPSSLATISRNIHASPRLKVPGRPDRHRNHLREALSTSLPLPERTRSLLRSFPNSVVVCTSTEHDPDSEVPLIPRAMTVTSMTSVSLGDESNPTPVLSLNIRTPSKTLAAIVSTGRFNIHLLADNRSGAAIADFFSKGQAAQGYKDITREAGCRIGHIADQDSVPVISGAGVRCVIQCRLLKENNEEEAENQDRREWDAFPAPANGLLRVRDHIVVFGEIEGIIDGNQSTDELAPNLRETFALTYANGAYRQLGRVIVPRPPAADSAAHGEDMDSEQ
ncbi:hypothetical protein GQ53DRAFT_232296 [Thozetella sp. PMI_491]|nr:hypothetical protein GQ53DRAFT_232296 [Thozetella sp. PMI_491]